MSAHAWKRRGRNKRWRLTYRHVSGYNPPAQYRTFYGTLRHLLDLAFQRGHRDEILWYIDALRGGGAAAPTTAEPPAPAPQEHTPGDAA